MKITVAILLYLFTSIAFAHNPPPTHPDTLEVSTQYEDTIYYGKITQYDTEDAIKQVEINDATVAININGPDEIFQNGFEYYNVNWIWVGDNTADTEFGGAGECKSSDWHDSNKAFHVLLICHQIENEADDVNQN